ncbi:hypothetical protein MAPG_07101, partial [Magnaporthiopsis poae ATCC 64411]
PGRLPRGLPLALPKVPRDQRAPARALRPQGRALGGRGHEQRRHHPEAVSRV